MPRWVAALQFVIPTGAYPDFLARGTASTCAAFRKESRMNFANATKFDRKSGVAEGRDLLFHFRAQRMWRGQIFEVPSLH
jgi:hypothetical protein